MTLKNMSGYKYYPYLCMDCLTVEWMRGDGYSSDPHRDAIIEKHQKCTFVQGDNKPVTIDLPSEKVAPAKRRNWRWGTQKIVQNRCKELYAEGFIVETQYDANRQSNERYGYRRVDV